MTNIVVLTSGDGWDKPYPFYNNKNYEYILKNYERWAEYGVTRNVYVARASLKWFDYKKGVFKKHWYYKNGKWNKLNKSIKPDAIFDKTLQTQRLKVAPKLYDLHNKGITIFNEPSFRDLMGNKLRDVETWHRFMPSTIVATTPKELKRLAMCTYGQKKLVVKEIWGTGGKNVYIGHLKDIEINKIKYPVLLQEFIKSTGFPKFKGTVSDLRVEYINHELVMSYSRVAAKDSLYTNTNKGAQTKMVDKKDVPKEVLSIVNEMQKDLKAFKYCQYAFDFFFSGKKVYFLESAATPGFGIHINNGKDRRRMQNYFKKITDAILGSINRK